jgi:hypothetical protein
MPTATEWPVILGKLFAAAVRTAAVVVPSGGGKYRHVVLRQSCIGRVPPRRPCWKMAPKAEQFCGCFGNVKK